jgi:hypothetical protein
MVEWSAPTLLSFGKIKDLSGYLEPIRQFFVKISYRLIMHGNDANSLRCSEWLIFIYPYLYPANF